MEFFQKAKEWMTPERAAAFQGIGMGLSQLSAGQPVDLSPAYEALQQRQEAAKMRKVMEVPGLMDQFTPQQRAVLASMPEGLATKIIMESAFRPAPEPVKGVAVGGRLVNPITGEEMYNPPPELDGTLQERTALAAAARLQPGTPEYDQYILTGKMPGQGDAATYGTTLQFFTDPNGQTRAGVIGSDGTMKEVAPPDGGSWATGIEKVDAGTKWLIYDKRTGEKIGEELKDLRGAEAEKVLGQAAGAAEASAPNDIASAESTLGYIDSLRNHPGRAAGTGGSSWMGSIPGSNAKEFQIEVERLKSGAFMTAIEQLRGMGALSNAEGQTATAAVAALATEGTEEGFLKRLAEYEAIVNKGLERARKRSPSPSDAPAAAPAQNTDDPLGLFQ